MIHEELKELMNSNLSDRAKEILLQAKQLNVKMKSAEAVREAAKERIAQYKKLIVSLDRGEHKRLIWDIFVSKGDIR